MVQILVEKPSNRLNYTLSIIFETIFRIPYQLIILENFSYNTEFFTLNYADITLDNILRIPNKGFLSGVDKHTSFFLDANKSFRENWQINDNIPKNEVNFSFDIFSAVFYLVSDYEKYVGDFFDKHHRYDETAYPSYKMKLFETPLVHLLCDELLLQFPQNLQTIIKKNRKYDYEITFDIDNPWKYKNKTFFVQVGSLFKDVLKLRIENIKERKYLLFEGKDVNDTFEEIISLCLPEKTRFFCLIDRHSNYDTRFTYKNPALRQLILKLYRKGFKIGIHPSYTSYNFEEIIDFETKQLSQIINFPIQHSRQHFLRYRLPSTFRYLLAAGITDDYSLCLRNNIGFPCGMAVPFKWYDVEKEEQTSLILHPTLVMDRALQQYMKLSPTEALSKVQALISIVKAISGKMTIVFHNESLSESGEWKGWSSTIKEIIRLIPR